MCSRGKNYQTTCLKEKPIGRAGEIEMFRFPIFFRRAYQGEALKRVKVIINMPKASKNLKLLQVFPLRYGYRILREFFLSPRLARRSFERTKLISPVIVADSIDFILFRAYFDADKSVNLPRPDSLKELRGV